MIVTTIGLLSISLRTNKYSDGMTEYRVKPSLSLAYVLSVSTLLFLFYYLCTDIKSKPFQARDVPPHLPW